MENIRNQTKIFFLRILNIPFAFLMHAIDLLKNDLVTEVVKEFPELQGVMGSYYAKKANYNSNVSHAIYVSLYALLKQLQ